MLKARIGVLVSGGGTNLQALIDSAASGKLPHGEIRVVVSGKPGVYALERAAAAGIPTEVVERKSYADTVAYEHDLRHTLAKYGVDVIVLAGFLTVLSADFVAHYPDRILNVHPSLIPSFCGDGFYGLRVHEAVLARGVKVTGATVHLVNEITDGGRILAQRAVEVLPDDTPQVLQRRVMEQAEWQLLPAATEQICRQLIEG